ncbi:hypothetical protein BH10PAT2_BH10PAT2_0560 [soil metagenome]
MKRYLSILFQITPWYLDTLIHGEQDRKKRIALPEKIGIYSLDRDLSPRAFPFATGLYKDIAGNEVVIKVWTGKGRNIYYFNIIHQIEMTKLLSDVQDRFLKENDSTFTLPRYIDSSIADHEVYLIMEKVTGDSMEEMKDSEKQFQIYTELLTFLQKLSTYCTITERKKITVKSAKDFIFLYPIILASAMAMHPKLSLMLLKGTIYFLRGIPAIHDMKANSLVHGDLHPDNILVKDDHTFYLLDTENMRFSYPIYESISSVSLKGNSQEMKDLVISKIIQPAKNKKWHSAVSALMINNITHNLTGDIDHKSVRSYLNIYNLATGARSYV